MIAEVGLHRFSGFAEVGFRLTRFDCVPHFHDTYSISVFATPVRIWCREAFHRVAVGSVVVLDPREVHWGEPVAEGCAQDAINPEPGFLQSVFGDPEPVHFADAVINDSDLAEQLSGGLRRAELGDVEPLRVAVQDLFRRHGAPARRRSQMAQGAVFEDAAEPLLEPIGGLSHRAGLSRSHFSRTFRKLHGMSPRDYRRQARVQAARALIEDGTDLAVAAAEAGFADQAHMTRQVRSVFGVTPKGLRGR